MFNKIINLFSKKEVKSEGIIIPIHDSNISDDSFQIEEKIKKAKEKEMEYERKKLEVETPSKWQLAREARTKELIDNLETIRIGYINLYDKNSSGKLNVENHEVFLGLVELNQQKILEVDHKYIRDFLRISEYLKELFLDINYKFKNMISAKSISELNFAKSSLDDGINNYREMMGLAFTMLGEITSKNLIGFYRIYEIFDSYGLFQSNHQKIVQNSIENINLNLEKIDSKIQKVDTALDNLDAKIGKVVVAIYAVGYLNGDKSERLNQFIQTELDRMNSNISYRSLIKPLQQRLG